MPIDNPEGREPSGSDRTIEERIEQALIPKDQKSDDAEPEGDPPESTEEPEGDESVEQSEEAPVAEESDLFEIELEGKKARVPKEFKDSFLRQADYSTKTAELAQEKRQVAEERQIVQLSAQIEGALAEQMADLRGMVKTVKQYEEAIQMAINQGDTQTLATLNAQYNILNRSVEDKAGEIRQKRNELGQLSQYDKQQRKARADEQAARIIPNFGPETKREIVQNARRLGFQDNEIAEVDDPRVYQTLWESAQWKALQAKSATVKKQVQVAPKTLPAKGQPVQSQKSSTVKELGDKLRKTGRVDYAERLIEQRLLGKR